MRVVVPLLLALAVSPALAAGALPSPASAEICGRCHRSIQEGWKKSAHASAMESRLFQDSLEMAERDFGADARKVCLGCHAPIAVLLGDLVLSRKTSWEGVTCDYCHSIREVQENGPNPKAKVEFSDLKSGPSKDSVSPAHRTAYSAVHTSALACAVCHQYTNSLGFPVVTTYSEWKESVSGQAEQECQRCHMYLVKGSVVDPRVKREAAHEVNLHEMPGSHSIEQLNRALKAQMSAARDGDRLVVTVKLTNEGAGHYLPTGSPMRQLVLVVRATPYGSDAMMEERTYSRTLADAAGTPIKYEHVAFLKAAKVVSDTRLAPEQTKTETFSFPIPRGKKAQVDAMLYYLHSPMASAEHTRRIKFVELNQLVP